MTCSATDSSANISFKIQKDFGDLLKPDLHEPLSIEFCRSVIHSGTQAPINGVVQLLDKTTGTNLLPHIQFIDPCPKAEFLTSRWHAQQIGILFGTTTNLLVLQKAVGKVGGIFFGGIENRAQNQCRFAVRSIQEAAVTGFVHNAVFRAVETDEGEFYRARLKNGIVGAGTWAALSAGSLGVKHLGKAQDTYLGAVLRSEVGSTVISGVPGGLLNAELKSILNGEGFAGKKSIAESIYTYSVLGGAWAGGKQLVGGTVAEQNLSTQMRIASLIARGKMKTGDLLEPDFPLNPPPHSLPSVPFRWKKPN